MVGLSFVAFGVRTRAGRDVDEPPDVVFEYFKRAQQMLLHTAARLGRIAPCDRLQDLMMLLDRLHQPARHAVEDAERETEPGLVNEVEQDGIVGRGIKRAAKLEIGARRDRKSVV